MALPNPYTLKNLAQDLLRIDKLGLPPDLLNELQDVARETAEDMCSKAAEFLHTLDDTKHTEKEVKGVIDAFPLALSHVDDNWRLPIQNALHRQKRITFVPLLAQEGNRCKVGGENTRGGLLKTDDPSFDSRNGLQKLAEFPMGTKDLDACDIKALKVFKRLKTLGLMCKEDIRKYNLLTYAVHPNRQRRFHFLVDWDPETLQTVKWAGVPIIHRITNVSLIRHMRTISKAKESFEMILKASVRHFPDDLGLLFQKHDNKTACEAAFNGFGEKDAMHIIRRCIPPSDNHPILHFIYAHVSQDPDSCANTFSCYYPDAMFMRDPKNGRTLFQSILASGTKKFDGNASFFLQARMDQLEEKDPVTKLFPFALVASNNTSDLTAVYNLLRRQPNLIWGLRTVPPTRKRRKKIVQDGVGERRKKR